MIDVEKSHYLFANLSWKDLAALQQKGNLVLLLPIGSTESHGPHAPLSTDALISIKEKDRFFFIDMLLHLIPQNKRPWVFLHKEATGCNRHFSTPWLWMHFVVFMASAACRTVARLEPCSKSSVLTL